MIWVVNGIVSSYILLRPCKQNNESIQRVDMQVKFGGCAEGGIAIAEKIINEGEEWDHELEEDVINLQL